jgi:hypothetical protein
MMRLLGALPVSLLLCLVAQLASAGRELVLECLDGRVDRHIDACAQPLEAVTAVTVGTLYIAKLPCRDCPVTVATEDHKHHTELTPNDLVAKPRRTPARDNADDATSSSTSRCRTNPRQSS